MAWISIDEAPRDGTPIAYLWQGGVSTCVWLAEADEPGWWDVRGEEPACPLFWMPIVPP